MIRKSVPFFLSVLVLQAGDRVDLGLKPASDGISYQMQLRVCQANRTLDDLLGERTGGGLGFLATLGKDPLKLRLRMDVDGFSGKPGMGDVRSYGLGMEALIDFPDWRACAPYLACGPMFQRWEIHHDDRPNQARVVSNKLAIRAEAGLWMGRHFGLGLGILAGNVDAHHHASIAYFAATLRF